MDFIKNLEENYKIPLKWKRGPVNNTRRTSTDLFCFILFIIHIGVLVMITIYTLQNTRDDSLSKIYDSSGSICGKGYHKEYKYLLLQTFSSPFISVCVKKCPRFNYNWIKYNSKISEVNFK